MPNPTVSTSRAGTVSDRPRLDGFYWVLDHQEWTVAYYGWGGKPLWILMGDELALTEDTDLDQIGPKIECPEAP